MSEPDTDPAAFEAALAKATLDALRPYSRNVGIRGGAIGGRTIDADGVTRLATLPPRAVIERAISSGSVPPPAIIPR